MQIKGANDEQMTGTTSCQRSLLVLLLI